MISAEHKYYTAFWYLRLSVTHSTTAGNLAELRPTVIALHFRRLQTTVLRFDLSAIYLSTALNVLVIEIAAYDSLARHKSTSM